MQSVQFKQKFMSARVMPVCLSVLVALSATVSIAFAKNTTSPKAESLSAIKSKIAPTNKKDAPKPGASSSDKASDKGKEVKDKATLKKEFDASLPTATPVDPLALMGNPAQYLNKKVTFTGTFNRFADIALDYKKAFRDSRDYVTFFILRPDVTDHTIPMAEMKLFFPRKKSPEVMDLDTGDKIQIIGTEFSTALDEPWIDVEHIRVLEKVEKKEKKHGPEF